MKDCLESYGFQDVCTNGRVDNETYSKRERKFNPSFPESAANLRLYEAGCKTKEEDTSLSDSGKPDRVGQTTALCASLTTKNAASVTSVFLAHSTSFSFVILFEHKVMGVSNSVSDLFL